MPVPMADHSNQKLATQCLKDAILHRTQDLSTMTTNHQELTVKFDIILDRLSALTTTAFSPKLQQKPPTNVTQRSPTMASTLVEQQVIEKTLTIEHALTKLPLHVVQAIST